MITGFNAQGRFIQGGVTPGTQPYIANTHHGDGDVRYSSNNGSPGLDICVNGQWQKWYGSTATLTLSSQAEAILVWAESKMLEEQRIKDLAKTNLTVADAANALKKAEEQLRVVMAMVT